MKWLAVLVLGVTQFLIVLDSSVMNVAISTLVDDFDTTVTQIQTVIALYSLVMAALLMTGAKVGDLIGRKRALMVGLAIYAVGSALTAVSWSVPSLIVGWSILEGVGAALILPALLALVSGNFKKERRIVAYAVIGAMAGVGIAVGPILGGFATTELSWRVVFYGEVALALILLASATRLKDAERTGKRPELDVVGSLLSAGGVGLLVFGVLQSSTWGWVAPINSPIEPFGLSLVPFMIIGGGIVLWGFWSWEQRRVARREDPLIQPKLLQIPQMSAGLKTMVGQTLILGSVFFIIPLYLQLVQGLSALDTGVRMLPVSIAMFITSLVGSRLATRFAPRTIVRIGLLILLIGIGTLLGTIEPELDGVDFAVAMALLGIGMGLMVSQLGNVVQSAVGPKDQSEAGGLSNAAQQLGQAVGVALIGSIVITILAGTFATQVANNPNIEPSLRQEISIDLRTGVSFVSSEDVGAAATDAGADSELTAELVRNYEDSQLVSLQTALFVVSLIVLLTFFFTRQLPSESPREAERKAARKRKPRAAPRPAT
ncbi:MAG: MFS transporter [Solirubrobacterales bacterium]